MSNKERAVQLIEVLPEYKAGYVVAYLQGLLAADEAEDDAFCEGLYHAYLADPDKGKGITLEEAASELGIFTNENRP